MSHFADVNRRAWDTRTAVHLTSAFYDVPAFKAGACTLRPPELALAGDPRGARLLHLQCHFGLDTLSWARRGAICTGVDFSPAALAAARDLSATTRIPATFVEADVQTLADRFTRSFDIVIATYGVTCWLHDLDAWASGIRESLAAGGRFILVEFHPLLDALFDGCVGGQSDYFGQAPACAQRTQGTYTDPRSPIAYDEYRWPHSVGAVTNALVHAGLQLRQIEEYPYVTYPILPDLVQDEHGLWRLRDRPMRFPLMYALVADTAPPRT